MLATNKPMLLIFHQSGLGLSTELSAGVHHLVATFGDAKLDSTD